MGVTHVIKVMVSACVIEYTLEGFLGRTVDAALSANSRRAFAKAETDVLRKQPGSTVETHLPSFGDEQSFDNQRLPSNE